MAAAIVAHSCESHQLQEKSVTGNIDALTAKTSQLRAMLCIVYGDGYETFATHSGEIKHNYLWLAAELAKEIDFIAHEIPCPSETACPGGGEHA